MPFDGLDVEEAVQKVTEKLKSVTDADEQELSGFVRAAISLDLSYMERSGVADGEPYDEDEAYAVLLSGLKKRFPKLAHLTEDFTEAWEDYLDKAGLIEWD
mgnify:CR=1 FL=1